MYTENLVVTRGSNALAVDLVLTGLTPPIVLTSEDKWFLRVEYNNQMSISKQNANADGGSDSQMIIDTGNNKLIVYFTQDERNVIPDSGFTYLLYRWNSSNNYWDIMGYGAVTNSGAAPDDTEPFDTTSMMTPVEVFGDDAFVDCYNSNTFYGDLVDTSIYTFINFITGAVKSLVLANPNNAANQPVFYMEGKTIKWPGGAQPTHPDGVTLIYSFQMIGDYIYVSVSDSY